MSVPVLQVLRLVQCLQSLQLVPVVPEDPWVPANQDHRALHVDQLHQLVPPDPTQ